MDEGGRHSTRSASRKISICERANRGSCGGVDPDGTRVIRCRVYWLLFGLHLVTQYGTCKLLLEVDTVVI